MKTEVDCTINKLSISNIFVVTILILGLTTQDNFNLCSKM